MFLLLHTKLGKKAEEEEISQLNKVFPQTHLPHPLIPPLT